MSPILWSEIYICRSINSWLFSFESPTTFFFLFKCITRLLTYVCYIYVLYFLFVIPFCDLNKILLAICLEWSKLIKKCFLTRVRKKYVWITLTKYRGWRNGLVVEQTQLLQRIHLQSPTFTMGGSQAIVTIASGLSWSLGHSGYLHSHAYLYTHIHVFTDSSKKENIAMHKTIKLCWLMFLSQQVL